jgi:hypothetical protein
MNRKLGIPLILLLVSTFTIPTLIPAEGQTTPYTVNGSVSGGGLDYYWISNVGQGDLFLLNVTGVEFELSYANLTVIETPSNVVQFIANTTSDLLLRIGPNKAGTAYTIGSTHQLSRQPMPYAAAGTVLGGDADFWRISNVTKGDLFLLIVNGDDFWDWESQLSYTNLSVIDTIGGTTLGAPSNANHIFQFYANTTSDLLLRISPPWPGDMAYTIQGTHFIPSHNVAVTSASTDKTAAAPGELVNVYANVVNLGEYTESFNVTAYYGSKSMGIVNVSNFTSYENRAISFQWDTAGMALGNYSVSVTAGAVDLEVATADNTLSAGYVLVRNPVTPTPTQTPVQTPNSTQTSTSPTPTITTTPTQTITTAPTQTTQTSGNTSPASATPTQTATPTTPPTGSTFITATPTSDRAQNSGNSSASLDDSTILGIIAAIVIVIIVVTTLVVKRRKKGPAPAPQLYTSQPPNQGTLTCSACGAVNPASGEFCLQCGARLKDEETRIY